MKGVFLQASDKHTLAKCYARNFILSPLILLVSISGSYASPWIFPEKVDTIKRKVSGFVFHIHPDNDTQVLNVLSADCRRTQYIQKWNARYPGDLHIVHDKPTRFS